MGQKQTVLLDITVIHAHALQMTTYVHYRPPGSPILDQITTDQNHYTHLSKTYANFSLFRRRLSTLFREQHGKGKVQPRTGQEGPAGEYRYSSTLSLFSTLDGVGGQRHAPAALPPEKTRFPLYRRLGGTQGRYGRVRKI